MPSAGEAQPDSRPAGGTHAITAETICQSIHFPWLLKQMATDLMV